MDKSKRSAKYPTLTDSDASFCYTQLAKLCSETTVNVLGVVKYFKKPFRSRGSDNCCTLSIVDRSLPSGLKCVMFAPTKSNLPSIKAVGDVLCLRNVSIRTFNRELQATNVSSEFTWMVFDGEIEMPLVPRDRSHHCTFSEEEKNQVVILRKWAESQESLRFKSFFRKLIEIKPVFQFFNLACQLVAKQFLLKENCYVLRVWDGTRPSCQTYCVAEVNEDAWTASSDLEQKTKGWTADVHLYDDHVEEARAVDVGSFIYINNVQVVLKTSTPLVVLMRVNRGTVYGRGIFVACGDDPTIKATKKRIEVALETTRSCCFTQQRSSQNKPREITENQNCTTSVANNETQPQQSHDVPCATQEPLRHSQFPGASLQDTTNLRSLQTSASIANYPLVEFQSIENIKSYPVVPYKFRCRVKCLMYLPKMIKDFVKRSCNGCGNVFSYTHETCKSVSPLGQYEQGGNTEETGQSQTVAQKIYSTAAQSICPDCEVDLKDVYLFSLVLEDNTGLLHVKLFDEDASTFLPDLPCSAKVFLQNEESQQIVVEQLQSLICNQENSLKERISSQSLRPWIECCVKSYYIPNEDEPGQYIVMYRMFDTILSM